MGSGGASLAARVVVISGGSRGLGEALVSHFLAKGDAVATFSRSESDFIRHTRREPKAGNRLLYEALDASDTAALGPFVRRIKRRFGRVDVLINNAAIAADGLLATQSEVEIERSLDVNLAGALILSRACVRQMMLASAGCVVNVSSICALRGFSGLAAYATTKAGLLGLTISLARELGSKNIRVNAVAPGYLETAMSEGLSDRQLAQIVRRTPLGRLVSLADVVATVDFLCSDAACSITGQVIAVDGGLSC